MDAIRAFFTPRKAIDPGAPVLSPDSQNILSQWRRLASRKIDHQQIARLIDNEESRNIALESKGKDAATIINTIDKMLKENQAADRTKSRAFKLLRRLAGASLQVPKSYLVGKWTRFKVEDEVIARGGFSNVQKGKLGGMIVAVKTLNTSHTADANAIHKAFCKECVLWMNISHPNILRLLAVEIKPHRHKFSMISEMMINGNIVEYIRVNKANRLRLLEDVTNGLEYLHKTGIIHGDLKGPNILINNETPPRACISDFGLTIIVPSASFGPSAQDAGGTFGYMAPELFPEGAKSSKEADMYAFGMVVYEVVTGARPFGCHRIGELFLLTTRGVRPNRPEDPIAIGFGEGTWEFIERCWNRDWGQRPTAREALEHFKHVAKTSAIVEPGSLISSHGTANEASSGTDGSTRSFYYLSSRH